MINDRIADSVFQQMLLRPNEYSVLATSNLNGDYLAMRARRRWGIGVAPGSIWGWVRVFEATHGNGGRSTRIRM